MVASFMVVRTPFCYFGRAGISVSSHELRELSAWRVCWVAGP
jgi:hypothetical protein